MLYVLPRVRSSAGSAIEARHLGQNAARRPVMSAVPPLHPLLLPIGSNRRRPSKNVAAAVKEADPVSAPHLDLIGTTMKEAPVVHQ